MDNSKNNKTANKIVIILCSIFIVIGGGYFIYDETVNKGKDIMTIVLFFLIFFVGCGVYWLLKKGWSIIGIKILIIVIGAILLVLGDFFYF